MSAEAETLILSAALGDESGATVRDLDGLLPEHFSDSRAGAIWGACRQLAERGEAIDPLSVARGAGLELPDVLAFADGDRTGQFTPGAVRAVAEAWGLRRCAAIAEEITSGRKSLLEIRSELAAIDDTLSRLGGGAIQARLAAARLDPEAAPPELRTVYYLKGIPICTPGNLTAICGQSKVGKGAVVGAMLGAVMGGERAGDCLGVSSTNPHGHAVVHFDSEQARRDHWQGIQTALKRAGLAKLPPWLISYSVAGWPIAERRGALETALRLARREFGGVHSLLIDGIADFVEDLNEPAECFPLLDHLQALGIAFDCPVAMVLHLNPGSDSKSRGHLGSQLERRAESNLLLERDDDGKTVIFSTKQRRAPILKADGPCFRWDDAAQMHISAESVRTAKDTQAAETARELAADVFAGRGGLRYAELIAAVKTTLKCSDATAERKMALMNKCKVIRKSPPNLWVIAA